ncbi:MAG TPA: twin-arginine translocase subunit TatC [Kofleriaceae bacterium]|nr:twin-arginine translocase subunit TatC [Kofleriaceae bacterium]
MAKKRGGSDDEDEVDDDKAEQPDRDDDSDDDDDNDPKELEKGRMPFLAHLAELRDRVRNAAIFFAAAFLVCWWRSNAIYEWLRDPMCGQWEHNKSLGACAQVFTTLTEPFWVQMSIGMWAGIFLSSPFIFYQLWRFIAPGLYKRERRYTIAFACFSAIFFVAGALFCYYFVLDNLYGYLLSYATEELKPMIAMRDYMDLSRDMMLAFGAVFELPLLIYFLALVGLVTHRGLWKFNRWFIVLAFVIGAILTPSPDVVSQIMMATPMIVLYNLSIVLAWRVTKRREAKDAILRAKEREYDRQLREKRKARAAAKAAAKQEADDEVDDDEGEEP